MHRQLKKRINVCFTYSRLYLINKTKNAAKLQKIIYINK